VSRARPESRTRAAIALARTGKTQDEIAACASVSRVAVCKWLSGASKPTADKREILEKHFAIEPAWWEEAATRQRTALATSKPVASAPPDVLARAAELEQMANGLLASLRLEAASTPLEKAKVMASIAVTLRQVVQLEFLVGAHVMRTAVWSRIKRALERALQPHPEAAAAVARELRALEEERTR
jgi:transcriptional regulator with XRE-family HTH domain